jgi:hypothetical protein
VKVTATETYWLQPFSNIDAGFQNPPSFTEQIDATTQALGYHNGGTYDAGVEPSAYFSPTIIAQLWVHGMQELDWFVPTLVARYATLDARADSPGFTPNGCNYEQPAYYNWTYTEDDILQGGAGAVGDGLNWAFGWAFGPTLDGLCGLFGRC